MFCCHDYLLFFVKTFYGVKIVKNLLNNNLTQLVLNLKFSINKLQNVQQYSKKKKKKRN